MVTAVDTATKAARTAYTAAVNAKQASKNATTAQDMQVSSMLFVGRDLVNIMKAFIEKRHAAQSRALGSGRA